MTVSWAGIAADYDRSFGRMCAGAVPALLDAVGMPGAPGDALLDAGCGTGVAAAEAVAQGWQVTGVDAEESMVSFARERVPGARFEVGELARLPYGDEAFAAVVANFAVNHAGHPDRCVAELRRVARPGAPIAVTVWPWQPTELNQLWAAIIDETGTKPAGGFVMPEASDFARTEDGVSGLLAAGGFAVREARRVSWEFTVSADDLWAGVAAGLGTIGQAYAATTDAGRAAIALAYRERVAGLGPVLRCPVEAVLVAGVAA